jgi:N-acetylmuramoyl-L-alanine amidase
MRLIIIFLSLLLTSDLRAQVKSIPSGLVKTVGPLPFLEFGPGDDRLGGAKMTYLDSNVILRVVDSTNGDYIVQLSDRHRAFIAKESVRVAVGSTRGGYSLSGSWKVYGDDRYDYLTVALQEKLPYKSQMQINPFRIVVDIFGATSNTNWVTQLQSAKEIRNAWYEQVEDDVLRVHVDLRHENHWGHSVYYDSTGNRLVVRVKRPPASNDIRKLRIAVDAGHGGTNTGASGLRTKILEKDYTLLMAKELAKRLRISGIKNVFMTRIGDTTLDMRERILMLRKEDPDILLSIHLNSTSKESIRGTSTYYRHIGFRPLSERILKRMLELGLTEFGNVGHFNFALNGPTEYPNCLIEVAFLSNESDERRIIDPVFHRDVARKIHLGVRDWLREMK